MSDRLTRIVQEDANEARRLREEDDFKIFKKQFKQYDYEYKTYKTKDLTFSQYLKRRSAISNCSKN